MFVHMSCGIGNCKVLASSKPTINWTRHLVVAVPVCEDRLLRRLCLQQAQSPNFHKAVNRALQLYGPLQLRCCGGEREAPAGTVPAQHGGEVRLGALGEDQAGKGCRVGGEPASSRSWCSSLEDAMVELQLPEAQQSRGRTGR